MSNIIKKRCDKIKEIAVSVLLPATVNVCGCILFTTALGSDNIRMSGLLAALGIVMMVISIVQLMTRIRKKGGECDYPPDCNVNLIYVY